VKSANYEPLVMQFSPPALYFLSLRSKYSPYHPLHRTQYIFFPSGERPSISHTKQQDSYSFVYFRVRINQIRGPQLANQRRKVIMF